MEISVRVEGATEISEAVVGVSGELVDKELLEKLGRLLRDRIIDRTKRGIGVDGKKLKGYSKSYKEKRARAGKQTAHADLTWSGDMLKNITPGVNVEKGEVVLFFPDQAQREKAWFHNVGGAGKSKVVRKFFAFNDDDVAAIKELVAAHVVKVFERSWYRAARL